MFHDNRRQIIEQENFKGCDLSDTLLDSKPFLNRIQENKQRFISKFPFTIDCNKKQKTKNSTRVGQCTKNY